MFKILVPIDFSIESETAMQFALSLSDKILAPEITLYHALLVQGLSIEKISTIETRLYKNVSSLLHQYSKKLDNKIVHKIHVDIGEPVTSILMHAVTEKIDLIVIGTKGTGKIEKKIFGSTAYEIMKRSICPVIAVPSVLNQTSIKTLIYATDLLHYNDEITSIITLAELLNAKLKIIHIYPESMQSLRFDEIKIKSDLVARFGYQNIGFEAIMDSDVTEGLKKYLKYYKPDLAAIYVKKKTTLQQFVITDITKELMSELQIPIMTIPQTLN